MNAEERGYFNVANKLAEALARTRLSPNENRIVWALLRKTYGWQKESDRISLSQFAKLTGMRREYCYRALKRLQERNMVTVTSTGHNKINKRQYTKNTNTIQNTDVPSRSEALRT